MKFDLTYQDLLLAGETEEKRTDFITAAIAQHETSDMFKFASKAGKYYAGENPTIMEKINYVYDENDTAHVDKYSPNHKIASSFFKLVVDQEVSYLLSNGIFFANKQTVEKLGTQFEEKMMDALEFAIIEGRSFLFWNNDHVEIFKLAGDSGAPSFIPFFDEKTGALMAGARYWRIAPDKPLCVTLFEPDGYTEYIQEEGKNMTIETPKRKYVKQITSVAGVALEEYESNYSRLPIFVLNYNRSGTSELKGKQNTIDALDLVNSKLIDNADKGNLVYWIVNNADGMDETDDLRLVYKTLTTRVLHNSTGSSELGEESSLEPKTIEAPHETIEIAIDKMTKKLFTDFQAFDSSAVSAGNQTATAIKASYVPLDLKVDKTERQVTGVICEMLDFLGIDDKPTYSRNKLINTTEEIQSIIATAAYTDGEYTTRKLLTILGDADQADEILKRQLEAEEARFQIATPPGNKEGEE